MKKQDREKVRNLGVDKLKERAEECRAGLLKLRLATTTGHVKDYSQFKKLKADLARTLTYLHQKTKVSEV